MLLQTRHWKVAFVLLGLTLLNPVSCQYNCNKEATKCSNQGVCDKNGYCICNTGFMGDSCSTKSNRPFAEPGLSKSFLVFWILFWIILNCILPYIIYLLIVYLKEKNCDKLKEHFTNFKEAFCCCLISEPTYKTTSSSEPAQVVKLETIGEQPRKSLLELNAVSKLTPKSQKDAKSPTDIAKHLALRDNTKDFGLIQRLRTDMLKLGYTAGSSDFDPKPEVPPLSEQEVKTYQSELKTTNEKLSKEAPTQGTTFEAIQDVLLQSLAAGLKSPAEP